MDERLRRLQRRFQQTGTVEDEAAMLREAVRAGKLTQDQMAMAAQMEHPASMLVSPTPFRPFRGSGVPQYEALEDFLFELFRVSPDLPYRLGLAYLRQTLPIFDVNPTETLYRFNAGTHLNLETPFSDLSKEYIETFQKWVDGAFCSVFDPVSDEEWRRLARQVRLQEFQMWFDYAGYMQFGAADAFHNAANAFHNYIRALTNCYDENRRVTPGEIATSLTHLRMSINSTVDAFEEIYSHVGHRQEEVDTHSGVIFAALATARAEIIPHLLG